MGHTGEQGLWVSRPPCSFSCSLLPHLLASLASRVVYYDKMKGRKDPPCSCLSLLLSHLPRGLAAGLEVQVMVGDDGAGGGDGCSHCGQQLLNMVSLRVHQ